MILNNWRLICLFPMLTCIAIQAVAKEPIDILEGQLGSRLYKIFYYENEITWDEAREICSEQGENWQLAEIFSQEENKVLTDMLSKVNWSLGNGGYKGGWIGLYEPEENQWQWVSGRGLNETLYKNWGKETEEPNNVGGNENCGAIEIQRKAGWEWDDKNHDGWWNEDGWWNDATCESGGYRSAICQKGTSIIVKSDADTVVNDGWCTLREAIENANNDAIIHEDCVVAGSGDDVIYFAINGVISLSSELVVNSNINFQGPGANKLTISGGGVTHVFIINSNATVSIDRVTIANGFASYLPTMNGDSSLNSGTLTITNSTLQENSSDCPDIPAGINGGGIDNHGTLTLTNSTLSGNTAKFGGGIYNDGKLTITNSKLLNNVADSSYSSCSGGGGIYNNYWGTVTITNSKLLGNVAEYDNGGGIYNLLGTVTIKQSELSLNSALGGGGIYNNMGNVITNKSNLFDNEALFGGGIHNVGTLSVIDSNLSGNTASLSGGGIFNSGILTVTSSTLSENMADKDFGGGIYNGTYNDNVTLTVTNSTLSKNDAGTCGGGIYNGNAYLYVINSTLSENIAALGGGTCIEGTATSIIRNTIIANSSSGGDCYNYNNNNNFTIERTLIEDGSCNVTWSGDPLLGPLANNGGSTLTHALLSGSIAIDTGDDAICKAKPVNNLDQRSVRRLSDRLTGSHCDIGAYEYRYNEIRR